MVTSWHGHHWPVSLHTLFADDVVVFSQLEVSQWYSSHFTQTCQPARIKRMFMHFRTSEMSFARITHSHLFWGVTHFYNFHSFSCILLITCSRFTHSLEIVYVCSLEQKVRKTIFTLFSLTSTHFHILSLPKIFKLRWKIWNYTQISTVAHSY